jgi:hypothetical protein
MACRKAQHLSASCELQSSLNALNILVRNFPSTADANAEIPFDAPSAHGFGVTVHTPGGGDDTGSSGSSHCGLLWIRAAQAATPGF